jgi:hypothetical protein
MMFVETDKERLLEALEQHRKNVCHYMGPTCDCKYGGPGNKFDKDDKRNRGEMTGCPELRTVIEIVNALSEEEIGKLLSKRGHIGV